jgi:hypothetical protein
MRGRAVLAFTVVCLLAVGGSAAAQNTFYTGDSTSSSDGLANVRNGLYTQSDVYQNFVVPAGQSWLVTSLFSNNAMDFTGVATAAWSVRSGVSSGNGGTVLASGASSPATQTATGRTVTSSGTTLTEYSVIVPVSFTALNPGQYWFNVTPIGPGGGSGAAFQTLTTGLNATGIPSGYTSSPFFNSSDFSMNFQPSTSVDPGLTQFSGGVQYTPVPEPIGILGICAAAVLGKSVLLRRRARSWERRQSIAG